MTQFKDKADAQEFVSAALFTYPVLMAGDILLYQTDVVPVGVDQRQHVELTRDVATRFNSRFGETFTVPRGIYPEIGAKVMDLQEPEKKMSTTGATDQGSLYVLDPPDAIRRKFKTAVTDSGREVTHSPDKPGDVEPRRDHERGDRRDDRRRSSRATTARATARSRRTSPRPSSRCSRRSRSGTASSAPTPASSIACSSSGRRRRGQSLHPRSRRCTTAWASSGARRGRTSPALHASLRNSSTSAAVSSRHSPGARSSTSSPA